MWVTWLAGGGPVPGASVQLWNVSRSGGPSALLMKGDADAGGLVQFNCSSEMLAATSGSSWNGNGLALVVDYAGGGKSKTVLLGEVLLQVLVSWKPEKEGEGELRRWRSQPLLQQCHLQRPGAS